MAGGHKSYIYMYYLTPRDHGPARDHLSLQHDTCVDRLLAAGNILNRSDKVKTFDSLGDYAL